MKKLVYRSFEGKLDLNTQKGYYIYIYMIVKTHMK